MKNNILNTAFTPEFIASKKGYGNLDNSILKLMKCRFILKDFITVDDVLGSEADPIDKMWFMLMYGLTPKQAMKLLTYLLNLSHMAEYVQKSEKRDDKLRILKMYLDKIIPVSEQDIEIVKEFMLNINMGEGI